MNNDDLPTPLHFSDTPSTVDQLGALCRGQQKRIASLVAERETLTAANGRLSAELLEASRERAESLRSLSTRTKEARELLNLVIHQRNTLLKALRSVCGHLANQPITSLTYFGGESFAKAVREAGELLKVVEQLQAQQAKQDAKNG